ncbi:MAG TPA: glycoside hydrolase family 2 TIM barrel-domain containing protein [Spirochaetia bacterium]|nr:glycoside hydrolase family 2 TIM barrel-domain containing protein [Spirochaetia bacterium]
MIAEEQLLSHPRPDFSRRNWRSLNGDWEFEFDPTNEIDGQTRMLGLPFSRRITVPFPPQSSSSGIHDTGFYPYMWYRKTFELTDEERSRSITLHFGAVDHEATVWVNDRLVGTHVGGYVPFHFDITSAARTGANSVVLRVKDSLDTTIPRGKQSWGSSFACWYTPMSGIWQSVWLEFAPTVCISGFRIDASTDGSVALNIHANRPAAHHVLAIEVRFGGDRILTALKPLSYPSTVVRATIADPLLWSPESPNLYDVQLTLRGPDGQVDVVDTYFGFRTVEVTPGGVLLNGSAYLLRLVLDQGYWPDSLYTPPSDEALRLDIQSAKAMGFNGCRKHLKIEDPRFLAWADRLGYLVWSEFPAPYSDTDSARLSVARQWIDAVRRDWNHPSIISWVIYNESWGIPSIHRDPAVQEWVKWMVDTVRSLDATRIIIDNDGWYHVSTDLQTYHSYAPERDELLRVHHQAAETGSLPTRSLGVDGALIAGRPLMLSEFGGIGFAAEGEVKAGWGYEGVAEDAGAYLFRLRDLFSAVYAMTPQVGFCYTQLTDVEQEINGLLTPDRAPKLPVETIARIVRNEQFTQ